MKRIISCSYKDDTPAFFSEEFFRNYSRGFAMINTKHGPKAVSLKPADVACIVFWTKNPSDHFLQNMKTLRVPFYIQWTISGYEKDLEPKVPDKEEIVARFKQAVRTIGPNRVWWRYDPILISDKYTVEYHKKKFMELTEALTGYTTHCVISFLDEYGKIQNEIKAGAMRAPAITEIKDMAAHFSRMAAAAGITVQTCSEGQYDLSGYDIMEAPCVDAKFIEEEFGLRLDPSIKAPSSFRRCKCAVNTDIGTYHRCRHDCKYCYAK